MKTITTTYIEWLRTKVDEDSTTGDLAKDTDFTKVHVRLDLVAIVRDKDDYVRRALHDSYVQFQQETDPIVQILKQYREDTKLIGLTKSGRVIALRFSEPLQEWIPVLNSFN